MTIKKEQESRIRNLDRITCLNVSKSYGNAFKKALRNMRMFSLGNNTELTFHFNKEITGRFLSCKPSKDESFYIYLEKGQFNIINNFDYAKRLMFPIRRLICLGGIDHNIENNGFYLNVILKSEVNSYTLKLYNDSIFLGTIREENTTLEISEDSFLLKDGTILTQKFLEDLVLKDGRLKKAQEYFNTMKQEYVELWEEINTKNGEVRVRDHFLNEYIREGKLLIDWGNQIKYDSMSVRTHNMRQRQASYEYFNNDIWSSKRIVSLEQQKIIDEFKSYREDLVKMMERPILSNLKNKKVKKFYLLCLKIQEGDFKGTDLDFKDEWFNLLTYTQNRPTIKIKKINEFKNIFLKTSPQRSSETK